MKPELQDKLIEVITSIQAQVARTTDFAVSQLPDVAQQYITYGRVIETVQLIGMLVIFSLGVWLLVRSWKAFKEDFEYIPAVIASGIATGVALFFTLLLGAGTAMVWFAPNIYLIKGLAKLLR